MMKKLIPLSVLILALLLTSGVASSDSPYTTWALGPGGQVFMTQDAYTPAAEVDLPIAGAEDMFLASDGALYIADTGNGRIVKLEDFEVTASYGEGVLAGPTGLFVDKKGTIYVADAKKNAIVILDRDGKLVRELGRPVEPLFGKNREFLPRKIAVDARENLYIISEGSVDGVVQMNTNGNFIGYFGANSATMSLKMTLQRLFLSKEQLEQFIKNEAASPSNLAIDQQSLVYTVTAGTAPNRSIRKFTVSGRNIFPDAYGSSTFRALHVSDQGLLLGVDAAGKVYEYDLNGAMLFVFGAADTGDQRLGTLRNPTAIVRDGESIYVLDKDKNAVVSFQTTAFARQVHNGVRLYMEGYYLEAKPFFEDVLNFNGSFIMSYQGIADAYYKAGDYGNALTSYDYAEDRTGYSQAFWELRNLVLQRQLANFMVGVLGLWVVQAGVSRLDRRYGWFDPIRNLGKRIKEAKLVDDFLFMFRFIRYPGDSFYYIKKDLRGSLRFAGLIYLWVIVSRVLSLYVTGFIFNPYASLSDIRVENEIILTVGLILLWNAANYLVSTISDGEGRVRDVIIGTAYSLFPYVLISLPIALISRVLTLNEIFLYDFTLNIMWAWTGMMLFIMVKEIHNYTFSETVRNVLVTLFTMALFVLTGYILYVLFSQLFDFITAVLQEIGLRG